MTRPELRFRTGSGEIGAGTGRFGRNQTGAVPQFKKKFMLDYRYSLKSNKVEMLLFMSYILRG